MIDDLEGLCEALAAEYAAHSTNPQRGVDGGVDRTKGRRLDSEVLEVAVVERDASVPFADHGVSTEGWR